MPLSLTIDDDYKAAFRGGDKETTSVLRLLKTALTNEEIAKRGKTGEREAKLTDEEALAVVKRQVKQLEEARDLFAQGGRQDLVAKNEAEITILKKYVPASASEEQVREVVARVISSLGAVSPSDFGKVMSAVMKELKGQADGTAVSKAVKEKLSKK